MKEVDVDGVLVTGDPDDIGVAESFQGHQINKQAQKRLEMLA